MQTELQQLDEILAESNQFPFSQIYVLFIRKTLVREHKQQPLVQGRI